MVGGRCVRCIAAPESCRAGRARSYRPVRCPGGRVAAIVGERPAAAGPPSRYSPHWVVTTARPAKVGRPAPRRVSVLGQLMRHKLDAAARSLRRSPPARVWKALTDPEQIESACSDPGRYGGRAARSSRRAVQRQKYEDKGEVIHIEPVAPEGRFDPSSGIGPPAPRAATVGVYPENVEDAWMTVQGWESVVDNDDLVRSKEKTTSRTACAESCGGARDVAAWGRGSAARCLVKRSSPEGGKR